MSEVLLEMQTAQWPHSYYSYRFIFFYVLSTCCQIKSFFFVGCPTLMPNFEIHLRSEKFTKEIKLLKIFQRFPRGLDLVELAQANDLQSLGFVFFWLRNQLTRRSRTVLLLDILGL